MVQLLALDFAIIHTTYDIWIRPHQIEVISFGQPRIGNQPFAQWASSMLIQTWRFVHDRDMIPHLPSGVLIEYVHSLYEIFETKENTYHMCLNTTDETCSYQYSLWKTTVNDHHLYMDKLFTCESSTI